MHKSTYLSEYNTILKEIACYEDILVALDAKSYDDKRIEELSNLLSYVMKKKADFGAISIAPDIKARFLEAKEKGFEVPDEIVRYSIVQEWLENKIKEKKQEVKDIIKAQALQNAKRIKAVDTFWKSFCVVIACLITFVVLNINSIYAAVYVGSMIRNQIQNDIEKLGYTVSVKTHFNWYKWAIHVSGIDYYPDNNIPELDVFIENKSNDTISSESMENEVEEIWSILDDNYGSFLGDSWNWDWCVKLEVSEPDGSANEIYTAGGTTADWFETARDRYYSKSLNLCLELGFCVALVAGGTTFFIFRHLNRKKNEYSDNFVAELVNCSVMDEAFNQELSELAHSTYRKILYKASEVK